MNTFGHIAVILIMYCLTNCSCFLHSTILHSPVQKGLQYKCKLSMRGAQVVNKGGPSLLKNLRRSKLTKAILAQPLLINKQLVTDLIVFIIFELFSQKASYSIYMLDELIFKRVLRQKSFQTKYTSSLWYFVEERGHAVGRLFMWNFFSKLACLALSKLGFRIKQDFPAFISKIFFVLFCFNSVDKLKRKFLQISFPNPENRRQIYVFNKFSSFIWNTIGVLFACEQIASYLKIPLSSLLAFGGVGGLTLGLSVKGIVGNFLGGLLLLVNEPFTPGDWVQFRSGTTSRDKDLVGRVESVGWGQTQIRNNDTRPIYIPNSHFVTIPVTNIERITHRKYEAKISISFDDFERMTAVIAGIKNNLKKIPKLDILSQPFRVSFTEITTFSLDVDILCYFATKSMEEFLRLQEIANFGIIDAIQDAGCKFALPSNQVQFVDLSRNELPDFQLQEAGGAVLSISPKMTTTSIEAVETNIIGNSFRVNNDVTVITDAKIRSILEPNQEGFLCDGADSASSIISESMATILRSNNRAGGGEERNNSTSSQYSTGPAGSTS